MSFRLLRVKRRVDQDPASSLYLPVETDNKRSRTDDSQEFKLFKIVERGNSQLQPTRVVKPTDIDSKKSKVVLLSDSLEISTVADAILINNEDEMRKNEISKMIKMEISDRLDSFNFNEDGDSEFVYDIYRMDLGRFTSKDIEGRSNCIQIVNYEQEFLTDEEGSESETFEDDEDSNAEDHYANDYPDEEDQEFDGEDEEFDDFFFDDSFELQFNEEGEFEENSEYSENSEDGLVNSEEFGTPFDLDSDDYKFHDYEDSFTECSDDNDEQRQYCYDHESSE